MLKIADSIYVVYRNVNKIQFKFMSGTNVMVIVKYTNGDMEEFEIVRADYTDLRHRLEHSEITIR